VSGPRPPRSLTPPLRARLHKEMIAACRAVAEAHGLVVEHGGVEEMDPRLGFAFTLRVGVPDADGALFKPGHGLFAVIVESYGLAPTDLGREFTAQGETFRITGLNPNRPKYPVDAERLPDRRGFKFAADTVAMHLKASDP
jgi:hypothetical protein